MLLAYFSRSYVILNLCWGAMNCALLGSHSMSKCAIHCASTFASILHRDNISFPLKDRWTFSAEGNGGLMSIGSTKTAHDCLDLVLEGTLQFGLQRTIEQPLAFAQ